MDTPTVTNPHSPSPSTEGNHSGPPSPILAPSIAQPQKREIEVETHEDPEVLVQRYMDSVRDAVCMMIQGIFVKFKNSPILSCQI